jgi:toxin FitB
LRFLLDTNVLSETRRPAPDRRLLEWLDRLDEDRAFISVVTLAEIRRGVALIAHGRRRDALANWLAGDLIDRFAGRILIVDEKTALAWGDLMAQAKQRGIGLGSMDGLIAATAIAWDLTLVTRNVQDFRSLDVELLDPWTA